MNVATRDNIGVLTKGNTDLITVNRIGNGLKFDGTNQSTFTPSPASIFNFTTGNFSVSLIVKILAVTSSYGVLFSVYNGPSFYGLYTGELAGRNLFYAIFRDSSNNLVFLEPSVLLNKIYNIVLVRSGTSMLFYIDGELIGTNTNTLLSNINVSNTYLLLGGINLDFPLPKLQPANTQFQNMEMYDFKIFNTNISAGQVTQLYQSFNQDLTGLTANLVVNYDFNQKSGTMLKDNSSNQLHGTLTNFGATSNLGGGAWVNSLGNTITY